MLKFGCHQYPVYLSNSSWTIKDATPADTGSSIWLGEPWFVYVSLLSSSVIILWIQMSLRWMKATKLGSQGQSLASIFVSGVCEWSSSGRIGSLFSSYKKHNTFMNDNKINSTGLTALVWKLSQRFKPLIFQDIGLDLELASPWWLWFTNSVSYILVDPQQNGRDGDRLNGQKPLMIVQYVYLPTFQKSKACYFFT